MARQLGSCTQPDASEGNYSSGTPRESEVEESVMRAEDSSDSVVPGLSRKKQDLSMFKL